MKLDAICETNRERFFKRQSKSSLHLCIKMSQLSMKSHPFTARKSAHILSSFGLLEIKYAFFVPLLTRRINQNISERAWTTKASWCNSKYDFACTVVYISKIYTCSKKAWAGETQLKMAPGGEKWCQCNGSICTKNKTFLFWHKGPKIAHFGRKKCQSDLAVELDWCKMSACPEEWSTDLNIRMLNENETHPLCVIPPMT